MSAETQAQVLKALQDAAQPKPQVMFASLLGRRGGKDVRAAQDVVSKVVDQIKTSYAFVGRLQTLQEVTDASRIAAATRINAALDEVVAVANDRRRELLFEIENCPFARAANGVAGRCVWGCELDRALAYADFVPHPP